MVLKGFQVKTSAQQAFGLNPWVFIKGSLEEILPSYEKLRNVCVQVRAREGK